MVQSVSALHRATTLESLNNAVSVSSNPFHAGFLSVCVLKGGLKTCGFLKQ